MTEEGCLRRPGGNLLKKVSPLDPLLKTLAGVTGKDVSETFQDIYINMFQEVS